MFEQKLIDTWLAQPLGALSKRELELMLLRLAIQNGLLPAQPAKLARRCLITLTKAHGYLADFALRDTPLVDTDAHFKLKDVIKNAEITLDGKSLKLSIQDASLRLWVEMMLAERNLLQGETLRRDVMILSPRALVSLLASNPSFPSSLKEALNELKKYSSKDWYLELEKAAKTGTSLEVALSNLANGVSIAQLIFSVF